MQRSVAEQVLDALEELNVQTVFGIPGIHTVPLYTALVGRSTIRHVLARHEQGAGFMADGYARASGRLGVVFTTTGPGVTNCATALAEAAAEGSPVLLIATCLPANQQEGLQPFLHAMHSQSTLLHGLTDRHWRPAHPMQVARAVYDAGQAAQVPRPGPAVVEIPYHHLEEVVAPGLRWHPRLWGLTPVQTQLDQVAAVISAAVHPVIIAGGGVTAAHAHAALTALAETLEAPVCTTINGRGTISDDHPLALGTQWQRWAPELLGATDVLFAVGTRLGPQFLGTEPLPQRLTLVHLDAAPRPPPHFAGTYLPLKGEIGEALALLQPLLATRKREPHPALAKLRAARQTHLAEAQERQPQALSILSALRTALPRDGILCTDMTMTAYAANRYFPVYAPRTFLTPFYFGALGTALPMAIGAKLARPDVPVVALCGDGGFLFTGEELMAAVHERVGVAVVVGNDGAYTAVKQAMPPGRTLGVDLVAPDFPGLARAYRAFGTQARSPEELQAALHEAWSRPLPTLIEVPLAEWQAVFPFV